MELRSIRCRWINEATVHISITEYLYGQIDSPPVATYFPVATYLVPLLRAFLPLATTATDAETANDNHDDDPKTRAQKRAKQAKLHQDYLVPISFLEDAVSAAQTNSSFNISEIGESFGVSREAYVRHRSATKIYCTADRRSLE
eukprot:scaffold34133_cov49-Attheya_sp.AAC.1